MTRLRKKVSEHLKYGKEFPFQDIMIFLSGVIQHRTKRAKDYDSSTIGTAKTFVSKFFKKENIEDKLIVDHGLDWNQDLVYDACMNFLTETLPKFPVLIDMSTNEESFQSLLANRFDWHIQQIQKNSEISRLWRNTHKILIEDNDFLLVRSSKKKQLNIWGLSKWKKKKEVFPKNKLEAFKDEFPVYVHLKTIQNPKAKKASPIISNKNNHNILVEMLNLSNQYLRFDDIFEILKHSLMIIENKIFSESKPIENIPDKDTGENKPLYLDIKKDDDKDTEGNIIKALSEEYLDDVVYDFLNNLNFQDKKILKDLVISEISYKEIADKHSMHINTVKYRIKKILKPKINQMAKGNLEDRSIIIRLIKKYLSKNAN